MRLTRANDATSPEPYPYPNSFSVKAHDDRSLRDGLGDRGLGLRNDFETREARKDCNKGLEQEIFLLRRLLLTLSACGRLAFPMTISEDESPDFICCCNGVTFGIEVTEATCEQDQREWTKNQYERGPHLIGSPDGPYRGGVDGYKPERDCVIDILSAVRRKLRKIVGGKYDNQSGNLEWFDLLIYPNSNASFLANDEVVIRLLRRWLSVGFWSRPDVARIRSISVKFQNQFAVYNNGGLLELPLHK